MIMEIEDIGEDSMEIVEDIEEEGNLEVIDDIIKKNIIQVKIMNKKIK